MKTKLNKNLKRQVEDTEKIPKETQELKKKNSCIEKYINLGVKVVMFALGLMTLLVMFFSILIGWWSTTKIKDAKEEFNIEITRNNRIFNSK